MQGKLHSSMRHFHFATLESLKNFQFRWKGKEVQLESCQPATALMSMSVLRFTLYRRGDESTKSVLLNRRMYKVCYTFSIGDFFWEGRC